MPKNTEGKTSLPPGKAPSHQRLGWGKLMGFGIGAEQVFGFSKGQVPWGGGVTQPGALRSSCLALRELSILRQPHPDPFGMGAVSQLAG